MTTKSKDKNCKGQTERRTGEKPRRRLVDLTRMAGTDRREKKGDRRKDDQSDDLATERPSDGATEEE